MQSDVDGAATSCGSRALEQRPVSCSERCAVSESVMLREKDPGCVNRCSHVSLSTKQQENEAGRTPRKPIGYIMPHLTRLEEGRTKINSQRNTGSRERCLPFRQCVDPHRARCVLYTPHRTRYEQPRERCYQFCSIHSACMFAVDDSARWSVWKLYACCKHGHAMKYDVLLCFMMSHGRTSLIQPV
jgi:hypothetical protein